MSRPGLVATCLVVLVASAHGRPATLDAAAIRKAVASHTSELRVCYEQHLATHPAAAGKVVAKITIGTDGKVTSVTASGIHANVETCIAARIRTWRFPPYKGPKPVAVAYPFEFAPTVPSGPTKPAPAKPGAAAAVDPRLVTLFEKAVASTKAGRHAEALATYRKVLATQRKGKLAAIPRFLATTHLQASYALIDLGRLKDARAELALVEVSALTMPVRYDYQFTLGNVLGGLGELRPMFAAFVEAISVAEDLDDMNVRPQACWTKILAFTMKAKDWAYLREVSAKALQVAQVRGFHELELKARVAAAEAANHRGK
jgi:hypothetical protein